VEKFSTTVIDFQVCLSFTSFWIFFIRTDYFDRGLSFSFKQFQTDGDRVIYDAYCYFILKFVNFTMLRWISATCNSRLFFL